MSYQWSDTQRCWMRLGTRYAEHASGHGEDLIKAAAIQVVRSKLSAGALHGCCPVASSAAVVKLAETIGCTHRLYAASAQAAPGQPCRRMSFHFG